MENKEVGKAIKVTCAIIEKDRYILAALRSESMSMPLKWEFPGGKIEKGEKPQDCIIREIREEFGVEIAVLYALPSIVHDYGERIIELIPFVCEIKYGDLKCREHKEIVWDEPGMLKDLNWADADIPIYKEYMNHMGLKV